MFSNISRRSFIVSAAAVAASPACGAVFAANASKKGFCGKEDQYRNLLNISWYYNWSISPFRSIGIPFHPMVWGWNPDVTTKRLRALPPKNDVLFGFNEPDGKRQANLSVPEALAAWPKIQRRASEIVSPSCVNSTGKWMSNFMLQADKAKLKIDSIGVHSYTAPNVDQVVEKLSETYALYERPIWVTEIGVADWKAKDGGRNNIYSVDATLRFMDEMVNFMEKTSWIRGYCWFPSGSFGDGGPLSTSAFYDEHGNASPIHRLYSSF